MAGSPMLESDGATASLARRCVFAGAPADRAAQRASRWPTAAGCWLLAGGHWPPGALCLRTYAAGRGSSMKPAGMCGSRRGTRNGTAPTGLLPSQKLIHVGLPPRLRESQCATLSPPPTERRPGQTSNPSDYITSPAGLSHEVLSSARSLPPPCAPPSFIPTAAATRSPRRLPAPPPEAPPAASPTPRTYPTAAIATSATNNTYAASLALPHGPIAHARPARLRCAALRRHTARN